MSYVNSNTLCIAGTRAYLDDLGADRFTEMTLFSSSTSIKSLNYNDETGELWYTDATHPEGSQSWSKRTIRYATDMNASSETRTIKVPDLDMYKVRVLNWYNPNMSGQDWSKASTCPSFFNPDKTTKP